MSMNWLGDTRWDMDHWAPPEPTPYCDTCGGNVENEGHRRWCHRDRTETEPLP